MLMRSKLRQPATRTPGTTPCNQAKYGTCPLICTSVTVPKSQMNITKQFNGLTYNTVYVIHCTKCAQLYIGESGRTLDTRFVEYLADIKHRGDKPVANHFNHTDHTIHNIRVKGLWRLFTVWMTEETWNHTWLINSAAGNQVEWMKDYNNTWLSLG